MLKRLIREINSCRLLFSILIPSKNKSSHHLQEQTGNKLIVHYLKTYYAMLVFLNLTHYHHEHNNTYEVPAKCHESVYRITIVYYVA